VCARDARFGNASQLSINNSTYIMQQDKPVIVVGNVTSDFHVRLPVSLAELASCPGKLEVEDGSVTLGGAGFNLANGLSRLGVPVELAGFASRALRELIREVAPAVGTRFLLPALHPPLSVVLNTGDRQLVLVKRGRLELSKLPWPKLYAESKKLVIGPQPKANNKELAAILEDAPAGKVYWLPGAGQLDEMQNLLEAASPFAVQMNEAEALRATSTGCIEEAITRLKHWAGDKTLVIITACQCALACADGHYLRVPAFRVPVRDTTGCGDGFAAATLATLLLGEPIHQALLNGHRNGASVAKYAGATAGQMGWEALNLFDAEQHPSHYTPNVLPLAEGFSEAAEPARGLAWRMVAAVGLLIARLASLSRLESARTPADLAGG
jgi:sugar/nucleoside kinase (ribokinase family)